MTSPLPFTPPEPDLDATARRLAELLALAGPKDTLRAWMPGCGTGETAFDVARLLQEQAATLPMPPRIQVIATDTDEQALRVGRTGNHLHADAALREAVLFARHDLMADAPLRGIDLVCCRQLPAEAPARVRVLRVLHAALLPAGLLWVRDAAAAGPLDGFDTLDPAVGLFMPRKSAAPAVEPAARGLGVAWAQLHRKLLDTPVAGGEVERLRTQVRDTLDQVQVAHEQLAAQDQELKLLAGELRAVRAELDLARDALSRAQQDGPRPTQDASADQALASTQAELVAALAENERARRQLEANDAAKDRFLAVLSHELRNPLASIASASELLLVPRLPEAALEKAAHVVQRQAKAMKVLLDELLDVSRLTLGRLTLQRRPVSVASVIQNALETSRPLVQAASHELTLTLPAGQVEVDVDPLRLAQVISNLVSNSAKYTPEGGRIHVSAELSGDEVVITVADNGIGMEPAEIERMFELFSQGDAGQRAAGGLGIGLALCRNIIELHGGWILASSAGLGQGSQLRIGLPVLSHDAASPPLASPAQALTPASAAEGELVLVADDNGDAAWGMAKLLELSGFRAVMARGGEEALRLAEQQRPAIALLDIGMPDLSGHEVARRLRKQPWGRSMILIAATGWGQESDVRTSMEAGFDAHLTKPLNVGRIRGLLDELRQKGK